MTPNPLPFPSDDMSQPMGLEAVVEFMQVNFLVGYDLRKTRSDRLGSSGISSAKR